MNPLLVRPTILGLIGALIVALRWFQLRRQVSRWTLVPAVLCVVYVFFRAWAFRRASMGNWYTLDNYIYYADLSFGFNPSLLANRWVEGLHVFPLISVVYESLVLAIAATYAYSLGRCGQPVRVLALMVLTGLLGMQAYRLLPACGPVYLLGSACYLGEEPAGCADVSAADLHPVSLDPAFPRNAIPSLHVAWALLVYWLWRSSRWRWIVLAYLLLTILATLGGGEHYLVDLVAAFPFALALWALCGTPWLPERAMTLVSGVLGLLLWIAAIRFKPELFHYSTAIPWLLSALLIGGSSYAANRLTICSSVLARRPTTPVRSC
jgi:PAP2 superfamily